MITPCYCGSSRLMFVAGKHSDLAFMHIPHLNLEHEGYLPSVGRFGGSKTRLTVCLDCGRIQNWKAVGDVEILENECWFQPNKGDDD